MTENVISLRHRLLAKELRSDPEVCERGTVELGEWRGAFVVSVCWALPLQISARKHRVVDEYPSHQAALTDATLIAGIIGIPVVDYTKESVRG